MNERIKELAEQADSYAEQTVHYYMGQFDGLTWEGKIKQARDTKFAELIVLECAGVGYDASYYECALNVSNKIKQHFGVEE